MGRAPCCDKANVKKGPWSPEEDAKLKEYIEKHGTGGNWIALPQKVGLKRCGKSCRLRWLNYLRPNIKHGEFSEAEDRIICSLYATIGSRWSIIASQLPGRTDNDIKNYWNTKLKKKMMSMNHHPLSPQRKQPQQPVTLLSIFQNSTSSSSSSSSSPPLSFRDSSSNNSSYYHPHQGCSNNFNASGSYSSYSSSLLSGNSSTSANSNNNFHQTTQESFLCHPQNCQFKDSSNNSIFVSGGEATSCSSSDGSCNNNNNNHQMNNHHVMEPEFGEGAFVDQIGVANYLYSGGVEDSQKLMHSSNGSVIISEWTEKQSGLLWGENPMDYGLEEIKELISSTSTCNNFLFDEKKTEESVIMYY